MVDVISWLWAAYAVTLNVSVLLVAILLLSLVLRSAPAALRARIWEWGVAGALVVTVLCLLWYAEGSELLPIRWSADVLPAALAEPMLRLATTATALRAVTADPGGSAAAAPPVTAVLAIAVVLCLGTVALTTRLAWGWITIARLTWAAQPLRAAMWQAPLREATAMAGLRRRVQLCTHPAIAAPFTWGVLRPTILLPAQATTWPPVHLRAVLLHELAHIARGDWLIHIVSRVVTALLWFQPLVWWTVRQLEAAREEACDDIVIAARIHPADYAECLLHVSDTARLHGAAATAAVSVGLARPNRLHRRLHRMLRPAPAAAATRRTRFATGCAAALCVIAAALLRFSPQPHVFDAARQHDNWARRTYGIIHAAARADIAPADAAAFVAGEPDARVRHAARLLIGRSH